MKNIKVYILLLGFAIFTGATFNLASYSVNYFSPSSAAAWRFGIAAIAMIVILSIKEGIKLANVKENGLAYVIIGIIGIFGFNALFFIGLKYTTPLNGALIMGTNPLMTTIIARLILKDPITKRQVFGIIFALIGVILVITQGSLELIQSFSFSIGDFIILMGNLCWALYGVLSRRYIKNSSPMANTTYTMIIGALSLILLSTMYPNPVPYQSIPISAWGAIVFMSLCTSVLGYLWWNQGIKEIGAGKTALFFNFVPIVTMIISFIIGTPVTVVQLIGTFLVILGVLVSSGVIKMPSTQNKDMTKDRKSVV